MKKILFATTALVATAGVASAEISLSGGAIAGLVDNGTGDVFLHYELDLNVVASGATDNGLSFGASLDLDLDDEGAIGNNSANQLDDPEIFIGGAFGTLTFGELDPMIDNVGVADVGFDGIGVDNDVEALRFAAASGDSNVTYVYENAGFTVGLSAFVGETNGADANEGNYGLLLGYSMDGLSVNIAYDYDDSAGTDATALGIGYSFDAFSLAATYVDGHTGATGYGLSGSYTMDALTVTAVFADTDAAGDEADYGIGAEYDLGGGLAVEGGLGEVDEATVWDLGLTMSF